MSRRKANRGRLERRKIKQLRRNVRVAGVVVRKSKKEWNADCTGASEKRRKAKEQEDGTVQSK